MFETGDAVIPLSTAVQWVVGMGAGAGVVIGYVWTWTLRREARMQALLDSVREAGQGREAEHAAELRAALEKRLEDRETWRQSIEQLTQQLQSTST